MRNYRKILIVFSSLIGLFRFSFVYAGLVPCGEINECNLCYLWQMGDRIIDLLAFNIAVPIGALLFATAGIVFLTAGGNEQRLGLAKTIFFDTMIGLIIIFSSWLLINTIFNSLASGTLSGAWNAFPTCN